MAVHKLPKLRTRVRFPHPAQKKVINEMAGKNTNIKAIVFDFIGVLLFKKEGYISKPLVDEVDDMISGVTDDYLFKEEVYKKFNLSDVKFNGILDKIADKYKPYKPLWDLLPKFKKVYKLAIINNGTGLTISRFKEKFDIDSKFDVFISSALEGVKKPDKKIYLLASEKLGVEPDKCLFMDDSLINIKGAEKAGMQTLWWSKEERKENILEKFVALVDRHCL